MDVLKEGYLVKKNLNRHRWKTRWFILNENMLLYYRKKDRKTLVGSIKLNGAAIHYPVEGYEKRKGVFKISAFNGKQLLLQAATDDDREIWSHTIVALVRSNEKGIQRKSQPNLEALQTIMIGDLLDAMQDVEAGLQLETKYIENIKYECSFSGSHLIDWLLDWSFAHSRSQGSLIAKDLMKLAHILPLIPSPCPEDFSMQSKFIDSNAVYYRFSHLAKQETNQPYDLSSSASSNSSFGELSDADILDSDQKNLCSKNKLVKEGFLMKKSYVRNIWKSRRVLLLENPPQLHLHGTKVNQSESEPLKIISLKEVKVIDSENEKYKSYFNHIKKKRKHVFGILQSENKISYFQAEDNFEKIEWIKQINRIYDQ